jgi:hypothetical protein
MKITLITILVGCFAVAQTDETIQYPTGFRKWVHIKSTLVGAQHSSFQKEPCTKPCVGGIYHFYANDKALEGYRAGKFPDGSVIADEFLELRDVPNQQGVSIEGPRRGAGMMVKDSARYSATGGWGFETFKGDSRTDGRLSTKEAAQCYACHTSRKEHDYVFTSYKEEVVWWVRKSLGPSLAYAPRP